MISPTILCVDDDPDTLAAVVRVLRMLGHTVIAADSPRAALTVLETKPVAVLVSDFEMPEMNGVELSVRAREVQPETVRIMLTGRKTVETAALGINVGEVFRFLCKPFEPETLRREVEAALAHHRQQVEVAHERLTVTRRRRLIEALEDDFPGISTVARDDQGAYLIDPDARHRATSNILAPLHALLSGGDRQR